MTIYERQKLILEHLKNKKISTINEISKIVWSSESSVRRDIKVLEQKGYVKQIYGGVVLAEHENIVVPVNLRDSSNVSIKEELAKLTSCTYWIMSDEIGGKDGQMGKSSQWG